MSTCNAGYSVLLIAVIFCHGCGHQPAEPGAANGAEASSDSNDAKQTPRNLAWLGGSATPLTTSIAVPDPDDEENELYPGGLVIRSVEDDGELQMVGIRKGDILVGVGDQWLPNKEDPTLDFVRIAEGEVSAEQASLKLRYMRGSSLKSVETEITRIPLERGLPRAIERYQTHVDRGLEYLISQQNEDGSFDAAEPDASARVAVSAVSGLAICKGDGNANVESTEKCAEFILSQLGEDSAITPLAASYALVFLIEAAPPPANIKQLGRCVELITTSQQENGSWLSASSEPVTSQEDDDSTGDSDNSECDVFGTFATNQILLSLAVAERNGMMGDNEPIEKAVAYLKSQAKLRIAADLDRRLKAGLSAGTATAFAALGMDRSDSVTTRIAKEALAIAEDIPMSRSLATPHILAAAILSRQSGVNAWIDHHRHAKILFSQSQLADGSFEYFAATTQEPAIEFDLATRNACWRTAHCCLAMQMQNSDFSAHAAEKSHPMLAARTGDGKKKETDSASPTGAPGMAGAIKLDFDPTGMDADELKEKMMEKLKEQGINIEGANIQIKSSDGPPDRN